MLKKLISDSFTTQYQLEEMTAEWKKITLLSFGSSAKFLINEFFSWYLCIKETFDKHVLMIKILCERNNDIKKLHFMINYLINF